MSEKMKSNIKIFSCFFKLLVKGLVVKEIWPANYGY